MHSITPTDDRLIDQKTLIVEWLDDAISGRTIDRQVKKGEFPPPVKIGIKKYWWESVLRNHFELMQERAFRQQREQVSRSQ